MYEERSYRDSMRPPDLTCYEVVYKETDLFCCTEGDLNGPIRERIISYRHQLDEYILVNPAFRDSLTPIGDDPLAPYIARSMMHAATTLGVGPMATVAGAFSEFIGKDISHLTVNFIIENGGDIYLKTNKERIIQIYANKSPFSNKIGIRIKPAATPCGVCTSSATVGPSLSLGISDAVCVVAESALFADGLATSIGNIVKKKDDIPHAIEEGRKFTGIIGILIVVGEHLGAWGDIDIVKIHS